MDAGNGTLVFIIEPSLQPLRMRYFDFCEARGGFQSTKLEYAWLYTTQDVCGYFLPQIHLKFIYLLFICLILYLCVGVNAREEYHFGELLLSVCHVDFDVFGLYGKCLYILSYVANYCQGNFHATPDIQVAKEAYKAKIY